MDDSFRAYALVISAIKVINAAHLHAPRHSRMQVRAVAKVPPIRERRRDLLHLLAQAEFSEDLHRPKIDKMRLRVGTGGFAALHEELRHGLVAILGGEEERGEPLLLPGLDVGFAALHEDRHHRLVALEGGRKERGEMNPSWFFLRLDVGVAAAVHEDRHHQELVAAGGAAG